MTDSTMSVPLSPDKLFALVHANNAFSEAVEMVRFLIRTASEGSQPEFRAACVAGAVACYVRPFIANKGLAPLSGLEDFRPLVHARDFAALHRMIREGRHELFAHYDFAKACKQFKASKLKRHPGELRLGAIPGSGWRWGVNSTAVDPQMLDAIFKLMEFQQVRSAHWLKLQAELLGEPMQFVVEPT